MTALSDYTKAFIICRYTAIEAGYVNDQNDLGGETNHGITIALANLYKAELIKRFGWSGKMRDLTKDMAFWLYEVEFWNKMHLDSIHKIHPLLADKLFDIAINTGKTRAGTFLQEYLNIHNNAGKLYPDILVDGGIGNRTIGTLQAYLSHRGTQGIRTLLHGLVARQTAHYWDISTGREKNERFTWGWMQRAYESAAEYQRLGFLYA